VKLYLLSGNRFKEKLPEQTIRPGNLTGGGGKMDFELIQQHDTLRMIIRIDLNTDNTPLFSQQLKKILARTDVKLVSLDMSAIKIVTSQAIGKLLNFYKDIDNREGKLEIRGISYILCQQFKEIHLDRIFPIYKE
jgi:anti-anti-sigma factor